MIDSRCEKKAIRSFMQFMGPHPVLWADSRATSAKWQ